MHYDWCDDGSLCTAIVEAVSAVTGQKPQEMQQLYEVVDPDALESLFTPGAAAVPVTTGRVSFVVDGTEVTVYTSGEIVVDRTETAD